MSDCNEVEDGAFLCIEAAKKLKEVDENHELLRYFSAKTDEEWANLKREFTTRFGKEGFQGEDCIGYLALAYFYANFYIALKNACMKQNVEA